MCAHARLFDGGYAFALLIRERWPVSVIALVVPDVIEYGRTFRQPLLLVWW